MAITRPGLVLALHLALLASITWGTPIPPAPPPVRPDEATGLFLAISDIHLDPFYDGDQFHQLRLRPIDQWEDILGRAKPAGFNPPRTDSNGALVASALDDACHRVPDPDFILYPGDLLAHRWQARYDALAPETHQANPEAYRVFTAKVVSYLASSFRERFPDTPILPTLGNEDSYCGDYRVEPDGSFLAMFAETWLPLLGETVDPDEFRETFHRGGYYSATLPGPGRIRLIVLNSVICSTDYVNTCGSADQTPALDQFTWLSRTLETAETAGEVVWILMHVPPGIDGFDSAKRLANGSSPELFWQPELQAKLMQLLNRHRSAIRFVFAGHTHMDDFRVISLEGQPQLPCKIVPAVSPIFGNNPGYQVYRYNRETAALQSYRTYSLPHFVPNASDKTRARNIAQSRNRWAFEYDSLEAYDLETLDARSFERLARRIRSDRATRACYGRYYDVGAPAGIPARTLEVYSCAIDHLGIVGLEECLSPAASELATP